MTRQLPYNILARAANAGRMKYVPAKQDELQRKILDSFPGRLRGAEVAHTGILEQVIPTGAERLLGL